MDLVVELAQGGTTSFFDRLVDDVEWVVHCRLEAVYDNVSTLSKHELKITYIS